MNEKKLDIEMGDVGFCGGVERADTMIQKIRSEEQGPLYILGNLIHNPIYNAGLTKENIFILDSIKEAKDKTVIIRTHGISPKEEVLLYETAKKVYDLTCPLVKNIQEKAKTYSNEGYFVIISGSKDHAETIGIKGYIENYEVVKSLEDVENLSLEGKEKIALISQSTFSQDKFLEIVEALKKRRDDILIVNTLCYATTARQDEMVSLVEEKDMVLVIGGKNSSNTIKLYEKAKKESSTEKVYHIEYPEELKQIDFSNVSSVAIASGTSTPDFLIQEVVDFLNHQKNINHQSLKV